MRPCPDQVNRWFWTARRGSLVTVAAARQMGRLFGPVGDSSRQDVSSATDTEDDDDLEARVARRKAKKSVVKEE